MRSFRLILAAVLGASAATCGAAPQANSLVAKTLSGSGDRFIELTRPAQGKRYVNVSAEHTIAYGEDAIEVRSRGAATGTMRYEFAAARSVTPMGLEDSGITYNFLVGERSRWATGLHSFSRVTYRGLWAGIDATYSGDRSGIKYHFDVAPGAKAASIVFIVRGARGARIAIDGAVEWDVGGKILRDERPVAFQSTSRGDTIVPVTFTLARIGDDVWRLGFDVGRHDASRALTVDPAWTAFAGLVGGNAADQVFGVARDASGNTFACGVTASTGIPASSGAFDVTANGADDAFLVKFNASGAPQFVTYLGGTGFDVCTGIALNASDGSIYLAGGTTSPDFPLLGAANSGFRKVKGTTDRDAFVTHLNASGNALVYSGVIGGAGDEQANAIAVDATGRAYVAGYTKSADFPMVAGPDAVRGGVMDAFVARVGATGAALEYSGLIGGNGDVDTAHGIAVASDFSAYVVGETDSTTALPSMAGTFRTNPGIGNPDGFVAKVGPTGTLQLFTILTGVATGAQTGIDRALGVAIDNDGSVVVVGETDSGSFPANNANVQQGAASGVQSAPTGNMDAFVVKLAANLSSVFSYSYLGGTHFDSAESVAVDGNGDIYVAGTSSNPSPPNVALNGFPVVATPGLAVSNLGAQDGFVARILGTSAQYVGLLGSSTNDAMHAITVNSDRVLAVGGGTNALGPGIASSTTGALAAAAASVNGVVFRINPYGAGSIMNLASGSPQSANVYAAFAAALKVRVTDADGFGVPGVSVAFTAPSSGPSAALVTSPVVTDGNGFAQVAATANSIGGAYSVTATAGGVSGVNFALTNNKLNPAAVVGSSLNPSIAGSSVTFSIGVSGSASTPTGTVDFRDGASSFPGCASVVLAAGSASCVSPALSAGSHSITGNYSGNSTYNAVASAALTQIVNTLHVLTDFNGDGKSDIHWANTSTGAVYRQLMNGPTITNGAIVYTEPNLAWKIVADADFNGDGMTDLLWRNGSTGQVFLQPFNASGVPSAGSLFYTEPNANWQILQAPDFDGDGKADILWWNQSTGQVFGMQMNGATIGAQANFYTEPNTNWRIAAVGDFAGSGARNQILWRNAATGQLYLMTVNLSGGVFTQSGVIVYTEPNTAWKVIAAADFNGDGKTDILYRNDSTGQVYILLMNGTSIAEQGLVYTEPNLSWKIVAAGDYNGDGKADLLWRNDATGQVYMMLMNGLAIASQGIVYTEPDAAWRILGPYEYAR